MSCLTYRSLFICSLISFCGLFADGQSASAQIVPDQTTATEVKGNAIAPLGSGTVSGGNLYHSFDQFNVLKSGVTFSTGSSTVDGSKINNILNRVTGENPSQILGNIESRTAFPNANLYLMNPNGVVFGKDARLDIGGSFNVNTGTSLGFTSDRTFSADKAKLDFPSGDPQNIKFGISQPAAIINQGNLTVDAGKNITFTAGSVINSGVLTAPSGNVALTSVTGGSLVDLRSPDLVLGLSVAKDAVPIDWNGEIATLPKLAELLTGKAIEGDRVVVKPDGTLAIVTTPAADQVPVTTGTTVISGSINTSSVNADGGKVGIFGDRVALVNSQISATGINGGKVLIGGDFQGNGVVPNAEFTYFDRDSIVDVSALQNGNGGKAIIWGDRLTQFFGNILSKGGAIKGDGGFVEVSGKENLLYRGNVDTSAINGNLGTLLLDPTNITIVSGDPSDDIQLSPNVPNIGDPAFAIFFNDVSTNNFTISNTLLNSATSNIILQALNDINVNAPVNVTAPNISFTAQAGNNINVNQDIQTNGGNISLLANNGANTSGTGSVTFSNSGDINLTTADGNLDISGVNITSIQNLTINSGSGNVSLNTTGTTTNLGTLTINAGSIVANQAIAASAIALNTTGNITTQLLDTSVFTSGDAGNISVQSANGNVAINGINTTALLGNAGKVTIQANDDIQITGSFSINGQNLAIAAFTDTGDGGSVSLTSTSGSINMQSGTVSTSSLNGNGGLISLKSNTGAIATGDLSSNGLFQGGDILIDALTQIDVGRVNSSSLFGSGGNVTLDPIGNVTFVTIDATGNTTLGANGNGGNINIVSTGGNVLGTGQLLDSISICDGATICTNGTGTVSIQHGITSPFNLNTFLVNGTDILNGTVGSIVTGAGSLLSFTGIPNGAGAFTQGNISITPGQGVFIPPVVPPVTPSSPPVEPNGTQIITPINPIIVASISPIVIGSTDFPFLDVSKISNAKAGEYLAQGNFEEAFNEIEKGHISAYENYLGETLTPQIKNIEQLQQELEEVSQLSGSATTVIYPIILDDRLELMIIPAKGMGKPFREFVTEAKESEIVPVILDFANNIRDSSSQDYLEQSQQLYNWLVRPYRDRLQTLQDRFQPIDTQVNPKQLAETEKHPKEKLPPTLVFVMDGGLRVIPVAALHDGKQFLIEKYALANLPYLRVSRLENRDRNINSILAMGLTESMQGFSALPSVKIEVSTISSQALKSSSYLDQEFTVSNLQDKRRQGNFAVLHLATHAQFISNDAKGAFIQFWNERLSIDRVPSLRFDSPLVEMLTLSACQTAVGQNLGLGGLAISSGAKSVLASLWEVSDSGTAPLMIQFYNSFPENITKAIALQRAQIDMLSGKVRIENGNILGIPKLPAIPLSTLNSSEINLKHPFFWSSFILIGNWL